MALGSSSQSCHLMHARHSANRCASPCLSSLIFCQRQESAGLLSRAQNTLSRRSQAPKRGCCPTLLAAFHAPAKHIPQVMAESDVFRKCMLQSRSSGSKADVRYAFTEQAFSLPAIWSSSSSSLPEDGLLPWLMTCSSDIITSVTDIELPAWQLAEHAQTQDGCRASALGLGVATCSL